MDSQSSFCKLDDTSKFQTYNSSSNSLCDVSSQCFRYLLPQEGHQLLQSQQLQSQLQHKKPAKQIKKRIGKSTLSITNENEDKERKEIERLRQLVSHHKQRECGVSALLYNTIVEEPIFMLWGSCVLDLRQHKDLTFQKDAAWTHLMKMEQVEIFDNKMSFQMNQFTTPTKDMKHISDHLMRYNSQTYKNLADSIAIYQNITNFMVNSLIKIKINFQGRESEFDAILEKRYRQFEEMKQKIVSSIEEEGLPFVSITSGFDYANEQTVFKNCLLSKGFLDLMGGTAEQYITITRRKGGLEFFEPTDQANYVKSILDLIITQQKKSTFQAKVMTYDNIELYLNIESTVYSIDGDVLSEFTGDNILTIQKFILNEAQLQTLHTIRTNQIINPLAEWQEDFAYSVQSEQLIEKFYQDQSKILKKMKKLNKIYKKRDEKKTFNSDKTESESPTNILQSNSADVDVEE